jgi:hypothetical protein
LPGCKNPEAEPCLTTSSGPDFYSGIRFGRNFGVLRLWDIAMKNFPDSKCSGRRTKGGLFGFAACCLYPASFLKTL